MPSAAGCVLSAYLLLASLTFSIDSRRLKETEAIASQSSTDTSTLGRLPFPTRELGSAYENQKYLGKGSFGMSFLVTEKSTGKQMVMKLLFRELPPSGSGSYAYYTWATVKYRKSYLEEMVKAAEECDISGQIHEQGKKLSVRHSGAQRVMNCFGHNIPVVDGKVVERTGSALDQLRADMAPLYLLLENCGDKDLGAFMAHMASLGQLTLVLVKELFKQIMEGLDFLASLTVPYIHHDLKPQNIVVKTQSDGTYSVHLIDFGGTTQADSDHLCIWTPCTRVVAPKEYDISNARCGTAEDQNFDYSSPLAFDVWSAGCILTNLITGVWLYELSLTFLIGKKYLDHAAISEKMSSPIWFAYYLNNARKNSRLSPRMRGYETVTADALADPETFSQLLGGMLALEAEDRFVASDVLSHGWLDGIQTADDLDYQAALPSVAASEKEKSDAVLLLYDTNDEVEVFSRTLFKYNGQGWTVGRVTKAHRDGRVEVEYPVKKDILFKTLDQHDPDIRPLIIGPQGDDDESISSERSVMVNFVPAKRRNEKPLAKLVRQEPKFVEPVPDVIRTAKCPTRCWKCTPAIDTAHYLQGKVQQTRLTYRGKYASYCFVPDRLGIKKIEDDLVTCSSKYEWGGKYLHRDCIRFMCQDKALFAKTPTSEK